jgi:hypothetical protein
VLYLETNYRMCFMLKASTSCIIPWLLDDDACDDNYCDDQFVLVRVAILSRGKVHTLKLTGRKVERVLKFSNKKF